MSENTPDIDAESESIENAMETFIEMEQSGTLNDLAEAANTVSLASEAMDDEMVTSMVAAVSQAAELLDRAAGEPEAVRNIELLMAALGDAADDPSEPPESVGMIGALRKMNDPEVQRGLGFLLQVASALGEQLEDRSDRYQT
ncbi:DUF1641 domain-containing protein [Halanaeroarchaeum sulfurireducens]|uniref:DUF1641 domain-containing protein n=1 Tax=Halanaeroarchaeum sulfurireducens TaxID=1604004 RepID=A0A0F7PCW5_9EURY|nr:DUF1641 domain-containing protein [Halanaeroarchaeum sulfurireducens]AKH98567.1 hypothetical protein HLASF_2105 [Halanaeroarchaeum sulfurireducens]ALG83009.1 hypothetical protein HLASA_2139 [Halanaeroarchaeum sulfurireducens]